MEYIQKKQRTEDDYNNIPRKCRIPYSNKQKKNIIYHTLTHAGFDGSYPTLNYFMSLTGHRRKHWKRFRIRTLKEGQIFKKKNKQTENPSTDVVCVVT